MTNQSHTELAARAKRSADLLEHTWHGQASALTELDAAGLLRQCAAALESPERVLGDEQTYGYAARLAQWIFDRHYAKDDHYASGEVVFVLHDDLLGVLTQIDNMVAGLVHPTPPAAPAQDAQGAVLYRYWQPGIQRWGYTEDGSIPGVQALVLATPSPQAEKQPLSLKEIQAWAVRRISALGPEGVTHPVAFLEEGVRWGEAQHGIVTKESTNG